jgi:hypothetical protein
LALHQQDKLLLLVAAVEQQILAAMPLVKLQVSEVQAQEEIILAQEEQHNLGKAMMAELVP